MGRDDGWSAEYLVRLSSLGLARAAERDFRGMVRLTLRQGKEDVGLITLPTKATSADIASFARLVSKDGWGKDERWAPVSTAVSKEFDDNELLYRLFLEHEKVSLREAAEALVIANSVTPRSAARIGLLRDRITAGRERNPTLPAWRYFLGRLLHEANLFDEARPLIEGIPGPLRKFDPFVNLAAEHYLDTEEFKKALEICERYPRARGMRETRDFATAGMRFWGKELRAIARDKEKTEKNPRVRIVVRGRGEIVCELFEDDAPHAVRNFISLVLGSKSRGLSRITLQANANPVTLFPLGRCSHFDSVALLFRFTFRHCLSPLLGRCR